MPSSRSSSLSRSNMRLNASPGGGYPGTAARISSADRWRRVPSRQTTRLSSRSVFRLDIALPPRVRRYPANVIRWRSGVVSAKTREWPGAAELDVLVEETSGKRVCRALAYTELTGCPEPGDRVLLNTTALDLSLGTGGYALVIAVPDRLPPDPAGPGHLVKARYTPLQATVLGVDMEAVTVHTGLLAARRVLQAELAIVSQGHGNLGTGTKWGFSGVACGA